MLLARVTSARHNPDSSTCLTICTPIAGPIFVCNLHRGEVQSLMRTQLMGSASGLKGDNC